MARRQQPLRTVSALWPPVLLVLVGLPLALELIGPNPLYGVRTAATLASAEVWYRANFWAGAVAVAGGIASVFVNLAILRSSRLREGAKWWLCLASTLAAALAMAVAGIAAS